MTKVEQYKCDYCGEVFNDYDKCLAHEYEHQNDDASRAKYLIKYNLRKDLCDYCEHSYFVYGCEIDCQFKKTAITRTIMNYLRQLNHSMTKVFKVIKKG